MPTLTESRDLYSVTHNKDASTVTVTWMNRIYRDGVEIDAARQAEVTSFETQAELDVALGADAPTYQGLLP